MGTAEVCSIPAAPTSTSRTPSVVSAIGLLGPRLDETTLVREDHRLDAVPELELGEDARV